MQKFAVPSRDDAVDLKRREKMCVMFLMNVVSAFEDSKDDLKDRLEMIEGGSEMMRIMLETSHKLLDEVRKTIPERQRRNLNNTAMDYEMRLMPKFTPGNTSLVVDREEFRTLVNAAQLQCRECVYDSDEANQCKLYQLLVTVLPMDAYPEGGLCPYNMAPWGN